ncbi:MAG TPA: GIDE domain-containing protein [Candidatus Acidoferrales bacterium]|nr:GIDE domain-containing protein [Candidatus Acidoferrales bacterium]
MTLILAALAHHSSANVVKLEVWSVIGAAVGIFLFIRGFQMLRFKRLIVNTPSSKIRSASMGLVEVNGKATGASTMPAGITGEPCYYYRAIAWQLRQSGRNREWKQVANESVYVPFFVDDSTGRLLIDPQGADLDLQRNFKDEFDTSFLFSNRDMLPENVAQFLARNGVTLTEKTRVEEYCVKPDTQLFVFGTLQQNLNRTSWAPGPHVASGTSLHAQLNFLGPGRTSWGWLGLGSGISASGTSSSQYVPAVSPAASARTTSPAPASVWSQISMGDVAVRPSTAQPAATQTLTVPVAVGPDDPADCTEPETVASAEVDPPPSVSIGRGGRSDPFVISWRSQRQVVRSLAWKSLLCIWGGPALCLICLYFLALCLGWN